MKSMKMGTARFSFFPTDPEKEIAVRTGDKVTILVEDQVNGWCQGMVNGQVGFFPTANVEVEEQIEIGEEEEGEEEGEEGEEEQGYRHELAKSEIDLKKNKTSLGTKSKSDSSSGQKPKSPRRRLTKADKQTKSKTHLTKTMFQYAHVMKHRKRVLQEILTTERTYVSGLRAIVKDYLEPFRQQPELSTSTITPSQVVLTLFSNVEILYNLQRDLLDQLEQLIAKDSQSHVNAKIGLLFLKTAPYMKSYTPYVNNYDEALRLLGVLSTNDKKFNEFLLSRPVQGSCGGKYHLTELLITPIQRIPRYMLLLQSLFKCTEENHVDYQNLKKSVDVITEIAQTVNERRAEFENINKIWRIQNMMYTESFDDAKSKPKLKPASIVKPSRRFVREGLVTLENQAFTSSSDSNSKEYMLYLFNDCFLLTRILPGDKRKLKKMLDLFGLSCWDITNAPKRETSKWLLEMRADWNAVSRTEVTKEEPPTPSFKVRHPASVTELTLTVATEQEKQEWLKQIKQSANAYTERRKEYYKDKNPLLLLCLEGEVHNVQNYIEKNPNANVNEQDPKGKTALHIACKQGNLDVVRYLMEILKVNVDVKDYRGRLAKDLARKNGHIYLLKYFSNLTTEDRSTSQISLPKQQGKQVDQSTNLRKVIPHSTSKDKEQHLEPTNTQKCLKVQPSNDNQAKAENTRSLLTTQPTQEKSKEIPEQNNRKPLPTLSKEDQAKLENELSLINKRIEDLELILKRATEEKKQIEKKLYRRPRAGTFAGSDIAVSFQMRLPTQKKGILLEDFVHNFRVDKKTVVTIQEELFLKGVNGHEKYYRVEANSRVTLMPASTIKILPNVPNDTA